MLKVVDSFTTRDGEWYPSGKQYSITQEYAAKYGSAQTGAAHHVWVHVPKGTGVVEFNTADMQNPAKAEINANGWANFPLFDNATYYPDKGERGPWILWVDGERVMDGLGLPNGWHVSTFLVIEDVAPVVVSPPPTTPQPKEGSKIVVEVDGEVTAVSINGMMIYTN